MHRSTKNLLTSQRVVARQQNLFSFYVIRIEDNALHRADYGALGLIKVTDTLSAQARLDLVDLLAHGNRSVWALGLTNVAINALIGY